MVPQTRLRRGLSSGVLTALVLLAACGRGSAHVGGAVASASPEATEAGLEILRAGGNAIDAAVAVAFALGVTEPAMSGIGAGMQIIVQAPGGPPRVINGTSYAPAATPTDTAGMPPLEGHRLTTIPTSVQTLDYAWRVYGSGRVAWADLLAPAIRYAEEGFEVGPFRAKVWARHQDDLAASPSARALFLHPDGSAPREGEVWRQPLLAETLRRIAAGGAEEFYHGAIAREIAADMETNGGWIRFEDLDHLPVPLDQAALHTTYRDFDVYSVTPPASGWVVLQILNVLERNTPAELADDSPDRARLLVEALGIGHTSRRANPILDMRAYEPEAAERLSKATAARLLEEARSAVPTSAASDSTRGETTHYSVADEAGMAVAVTTSINAYFGSRVVTPSLGFLYNDYMAEFQLDSPEHPYALRPGGMPSSSMSASIVARDGRPLLAVGSPGSARIISAVAQVIQRWVDQGQDVVAAISAPRLHVVPPSTLYLEDPALEAREGPAFESLGYRLTRPADDIAMRGLNAYWGGVHAVAWQGGRWVGAADPRRDGVGRVP